jgi:peptidoglycan biosynthesis protein MviN/MurJ (putative lipid II flippase)
MLVALFSIALNTGVNWFFIRWLKWPHWSLALGTAIVAATDLILLSVLFRAKLSGLWERRLWWGLAKIIASSLVMAGAVHGFFVATTGVAGPDTLPRRLFFVFPPIGLAVLVYFSMTWLLGMAEAHALVSRLKRLTGRVKPS